MFYTVFVITCGFFVLFLLYLQHQNLIIPLVVVCMTIINYGGMFLSLHLDKNVGRDAKLLILYALPFGSGIWQRKIDVVYPQCNEISGV